MIETASQHDIKALKEKLARFYHFFLQNNDQESANKAKQLLFKLHQQEYSIAFCGHFSAGKSSMINRLMGEELLPSSPIPTSANLVKVKSGEEYAKVYFKEENPHLYPAPYDYEKVKSYCKDGDSIQAIEISHCTKALPADVCIMDTPGIDSTDDAHRVATESALHLADLVFYVMDYNHVQSELNFLFTKELTEAGKELYLVINQIDKHREEELSFESFRASVQQSFADWGVEPERIFYTSLRDEQHRYNQFNELQQLMQLKFEAKDVLLSSSVYRSLSNLSAEHRQFQTEKAQETLENYEEQLRGVTEEEQARLPLEVERLEAALQNISSMGKEKEKEFEAGLNSILSNAYLMPFETRALAENFLQATDPDFKVGLFFSKQKTELEREERLERFFLDLQDKIDSQITWHLKDFLVKKMKEEEIQDTDLLHEIQEFSVELPKEMLKQTLKKGARLSGEYVLNYTAEVAELAKRVARQRMKPIKENYLQKVESDLNEQKHNLQQELHKYSQLLNVWQQKETLLTAKMAKAAEVEQILLGHDEQPINEEIILQLVKEEQLAELIVERQDVDHVITEVKKGKEIVLEQPQHQQSQIEKTVKMETAVKRLLLSSQKLEEIPGFKKISMLLKEKAERLEEKGFTVALFGAFSAGKSSFANSLIGEKLLPVSPNPTTAAINKIMPVDEAHPHGLVKVQFKQEQVLFEDINRSLAVFNVQAQDFDEALIQINEILERKGQLEVFEKTHFSFLKAFFKGFNHYRNQLGNVLQTDIMSFQEFVANEEKSCLVEQIDVHYDCEITRKGITLVDTPGADSINARHTGVAFEYIKNSDAILFVTYYNHAFSKADREFLIQLGRVKDSFELDKMFFIVNAVDLANNDKEKEEVLAYVQDELVRFGIRNPSLYPVSSLQAIEEKLGHRPSSQSGLTLFEKNFYSFITNELTQVSINAAMIEWKRALEQLRRFIDSAKENRELKQAKIKLLNAELVEVENKIMNQNPKYLLTRFAQELEELVYYLKQRVFFRFHDFFTESFNPSLLKDDGRNLKKMLEHALDDFLTNFGFDFSQELRATTLRMEIFIGKLMKESHHQITKELLKRNEQLSFSQPQLEQIESLDFNNVLTGLERNMFKKTLAYFKNPKSFFEKNEKRLLEESLQETLQEPVDVYLQEEKTRIGSHYEKVLKDKFTQLLQLMLEEAREYYQGMLAALSNDIPIETLIKIEEELSQIE